MFWHALLTSPLAGLALVPATLDRVVVWGGLALVIALIAWREYTLPKIAPPSVALPDAPRPPERPGPEVPSR
jgi:hypothetical protein